LFPHKRRKKERRYIVAQKATFSEEEPGRGQDGKEVMPHMCRKKNNLTAIHDGKGGWAKKGADKMRLRLRRETRAL